MKRTSRSSSLSSSASVASSPRSHKRLRSSSNDDDDSKNKPLKVYIIQAKLDEKAIRELFDLIEHPSPRQNLGLMLCSSAEEADIILTNIRMKKRFERHVDWKTAVCYLLSTLRRSDNTPAEAESYRHT
jgi:DNA polymerase mu